MIIILKNKQTLKCEDFYFKCSIGKRGIAKKKIEGDKKTPSGVFNIGKLFYRKDRNFKPDTKLDTKIIKKNMVWCDDVEDKKFYNKLADIKKVKKYETLYRKDYKYDFFIPIMYNYKKTKQGKGSAIFIHLTKNYKPTAGCIALSKKDFIILTKIVDKNTKIKII